MAITACHYIQVFDMLKEAASTLIVIAVLPLIANDPTTLCITAAACGDNSNVGACPDPSSLCKGCDI